MKKYGIIILLLIMLTLSCGCSDYSNVKADDTFSKAINKKLGAEEIYYQGKMSSDDNTTYYKYLLYVENEGQLERLVKAANQIVAEEKMTDKITVGCYVPIPGGRSVVLLLKNHSDGAKEGADYDGFWCCQIGGTHIVETMYNDPAAYYNLPGIKHLIISGEVAKATEEQNIDWTEYYPDLETLEIISDEN